jgi:hypothetical protein
MLFAVAVVIALLAAAAMFATTRSSPPTASRPACPASLMLSDPRIGDSTGPRATCVSDGACLSVSTRGASPL